MKFNPIGYIASKAVEFYQNNLSKYTNQCPHIVDNCSEVVKSQLSQGNIMRALAVVPLCGVANRADLINNEDYSAWQLFRGAYSARKAMKKINSPVTLAFTNGQYLATPLNMGEDGEVANALRECADCFDFTDKHCSLI